MDKSQNPTAIEIALTSLRQDVLSLAYLPGTKLKVEHLQQTYGLSSSPIREALNRLTWFLMLICKTSPACDC
ncbi:MAG: GntR family transcriptional regulator [Burkholderiales bacterium]|nr:GntR family transcriptional regulator [Burkholderiales bacterium]